MEDGCENYITFLTTPPSEKSDTLLQSLYKIFFHFRKKIPGIPLLEFQVFFLCKVLLKQSSIQFVGGFLFDFFQHFLSTSSCVFSLNMLPHATYFL